MKKLLFIICLLTGTALASQTWYVRLDGGTSKQCIGKTNAAYTGGMSAEWNVSTAYALNATLADTNNNLEKSHYRGHERGEISAFVERDTDETGAVVPIEKEIVSNDISGLLATKPLEIKTRFHFGVGSPRLFNSLLLKTSFASRFEPCGLSKNLTTYNFPSLHRIRGGCEFPRILLIKWTAAVLFAICKIL